MKTSAKHLYYLGGIAGLVGGVLRITSSFIPYSKELIWLEVFYAIIDTCLLFSLIAIYIQYAEQLKGIGLVAFVLSASGIASIVGPDAVAFGVNFYETGAFISITGLVLLSIQMLRLKILFWAPCLWVLSFILAISTIVLNSSVFFMGAGITFGAAFVFSGSQLMKQH
jgi:hypothetical protein